MCYWQPGWLLFTALPGLRVPQDSALSVHYQITRMLQELPGQEGASYTQSASIRKAEKQQKGSWVLFGAVLPLLEALSTYSPSSLQPGSSMPVAFSTHRAALQAAHIICSSLRSQLFDTFYFTLNTEVLLPYHEQTCSTSGRLKEFLAKKIKSGKSKFHFKQWGI